MNKKITFFIMIFSASLVLGCSEAVSTTQQEPGKTPSIYVKGEGRVETVPDQATASFGVSSEEKSLDKAYRDNTKSMNAVIRTVKETGIADKDIRTSGFSVSPVYPQDERGRRMPGTPVGFRVQQQLTITVRDLPRLGELIDRVMTQGTNVFNGIQFSSSKVKELEKQAKSLAAKDARDNADLLAESLGVKLGKLLTVSEELMHPIPMGNVRMMMSEASGAPQIKAGSMEISAVCNVEYAIVQ